MWKDEPEVANWIRKVARHIEDLKIAPSAPVVEFGSFAMHDHNPRLAFPQDRAYIGLDARPGPGVDQVWCSGTANSLPVPIHSAVATLSVSALEHDPHIVKTLTAMVLSTMPGGIIALSFPLDPWAPHEIECAPDGSYYVNPPVALVLHVITAALMHAVKEVEWMTVERVMRNATPHWPRANVIIKLATSGYTSDAVNAIVRGLGDT